MKTTNAPRLAAACRSLAVMAAGLLICTHNSAAAESTAKTPETLLRDAIRELASPDDMRRVAATRRILKEGKRALAPLRQAGARQMTPGRNAAGGPRRLDMVYTLLDSFKPNGHFRGYASHAMQIDLVEGVTSEEIQRMGRKYGFRPVGPGLRAPLAVKVEQDKKLDEVIRGLLLNEYDVRTVTLEYWEKQPQIIVCPEGPFTPAPLPALKEQLER